VTRDQLTWRPADPEIPTSLGDMADFGNISKNVQIALYLALILGHEHLLHPNPGRFMETFL